MIENSISCTLKNDDCIVFAKLTIFLFSFVCFRLQEQFRKEQMKMNELMSEKDALIQAQEDRINALDRTNTQLLMALEHIREL